MKIEWNDFLFFDSMLLCKHYIRDAFLYVLYGFDRKKSIRNFSISIISYC